MRKACACCKKGFISKHRGWYEDYVPELCSAECFRRILANVYYDEESRFLNPESCPGIEPFKHQAKDMRSGYEVEFNKWLHKMKIPHQYEPYIITLKDGSRYVPDFWVYGSVFVEVKGLWTSEAKKKFKATIKEFYGLPIIVIDRQFLDMIKRTSK